MSYGASILADELESVMQKICVQILGTTLEIHPRPLPKILNCRTSRVRLRGAWNGEVRVEMSERLATSLTKKLFEGQESGLSDEHSVDDVMRELANMVGGNLKNVMPEPTELCLPESCAACPPITATQSLVLERDFVTLGDCVHVTVIASDN